MTHFKIRGNSRELFPHHRRWLESAWGFLYSNCGNKCGPSKKKQNGGETYGENRGQRTVRFRLRGATTWMVICSEVTFLGGRTVSEHDRSLADRELYYGRPPGIQVGGYCGPLLSSWTAPRT